MEYEGRPVKFQHYTHSDGWLENFGTFIKWGSDMDNSMGMPMQTTFAVVEDGNGQVYRIAENNLKFTDRGPLRL